MKKIILYYGPKTGFIEQLPYNVPITTVSELAILSDKKMREYVFRIQGRATENTDPKSTKTQVPCLVGFSDQYAALSDSAIQSFISFVGQYDIENIYLQNPPSQLVAQFDNMHLDTGTIRYEYNIIDRNAIKEIARCFPKTIIGQDNVLHQLLISLYPLCRANTSKPVVLLFYGPTGVGKSETAQFLSRVTKQKLMRRQFSMFISGEFASYLFGGRHTQSSLAKDLMERESSIILFDEFDKSNPVFHSAFYQIFDEGVYEDKNYRAEVGKAVIICTSNYASADEAKEKLGAPLFARFDAVIKFDPLSEETINAILTREFREVFNNLEKQEQEIISPDNIFKVLLKHIKTLENAREIKRLVRDAITDALLTKVFSTRQNCNSPDSSCLYK